MDIAREHHRQRHGDAHLLRFWAMPTIYPPAADDGEVASLVSDRLHFPPLAEELKLVSPLVSAKSLQEFSPTHS